MHGWSGLAGCDVPPTPPNQWNSAPFDERIPAFFSDRKMDCFSVDTPRFSEETIRLKRFSVSLVSFIHLPPSKWPIPFSLRSLCVPMFRPHSDHLPPGKFRDRSFPPQEKSAELFLFCFLFQYCCQWILLFCNRWFIFVNNLSFIRRNFKLKRWKILKKIELILKICIFL